MIKAATPPSADRREWSVGTNIKSEKSLTLTRLSKHVHHSCDLLRVLISAYLSATARVIQFKVCYWTYSGKKISSCTTTFMSGGWF